jgi:hypothetical protein
MARGGLEFDSGSERTLLVGLRHCKSQGGEKKEKGLGVRGKKGIEKE